MKDDKDPFGSWIRIGMLHAGCWVSWVVDQKRYWYWPASASASTSAHHTHYPTVRVLLAAVAIWGKDKRLKRRLDVCACA